MTTDSGRQDLYLGIDVGGTKAVVVVAHDEGDILAESRLEHWTRGGWREDLRTLSAECERLVASAGIDKRRIAALGVSSPGPLSVREGRVIETPNLEGWRDVPIVAHLSEALGVPVRLDNDANAATYGEWWLGAGRSVNNLVGVTLGTGIGGGVVLNGEIYHGASDAAAEIGHMTINSTGRKCKCGNYGCLEAYASGPAIALRAIEGLEAGAESILTQMAPHLEDITAETVFEAVVTGDRYASEVVSDTAKFLGTGVANVINLLNPEMVVIAGGVTKAGEHLMVPLRAEVRLRAFKVAEEACRIVPAQLRTTAGVIGAAACFKKETYGEV